MQKASQKFLNAVGPGIVYAAAAVGISHLVQATRAGAAYGLFIGFIMALIFILKYPALRFGAEYAAITGQSLVESYKKQGRWIIYLVAAVAFFSMIFIVASLSLVTGGLFKAMFSVEWPDGFVAAVLLLLSSVVLTFGHYRVLEKISKFLVPVFSLCILLAMAVLLYRMEWKINLISIPSLNTQLLISIVLLAGFMPTPLDGSILQSLWTCAKADDAGTRFSYNHVLLDFNTGYFISFVLAICFMLLGAFIIGSSGLVLDSGAGVFAAQVISLFTATIGEWVFPFISLAAFTVMLSTLLTILDGYPRIISRVIDNCYDLEYRRWTEGRVLNTFIIINVIGSTLVIALLMQSFQKFIDFTSALVFLTAPIFAILNHLSVTGDDIPPQYTQSRFMLVWSLSGIIVMTLMSIIYLYIVITGT